MSNIVPANSLPMVTLGDTGKQVSRFCLGGFHQVEISSEIVAQVVDAFLANGGNYIETARSYGGGASEEKLGRALEGRRDQVVLCTKTGARSADEARRELELSLQALRTDYVDFCLFHGVGEGELDQITAPGGALEGLQKAIDEGMLGALGVSSHWPPVYLEAFDRLPLSLILIWCNYLDNLNYPIIPNEIIPEARKRGIGVTGMKPLADGFLYRSVGDAVRYALGCGIDVTVCGTNRVEHVEEVAAAVREGPADEAMKGAILRDAVDLGQYVCRQCGDCTPALMDTFRLEGVYDRQMIDYMAHDPADYALRVRLAHWFAGRERAVAHLTAAGYDPQSLIADAGQIECPYGIDVARKATIATAKLTEQRANRV
ncbi:MAG TPA: aldo/keto reductase [Anaerolineae bacterium]|nr:aldo/keto reductase [Anaerolineae bacterium]